MAEKLKGAGKVISRDLTEYKVSLIRDNIERMGYTNIELFLKGRQPPGLLGAAKAPFKAHSHRMFFQKPSQHPAGSLPPISRNPHLHQPFRAGERRV